MNLLLKRQVCLLQHNFANPVDFQTSVENCPPKALLVFCLRLSYVLCYLFDFTISNFSGRKEKKYYNNNKKKPQKKMNLSLLNLKDSSLKKKKKNQRCNKDAKIFVRRLSLLTAKICRQGFHENSLFQYLYIFAIVTRLYY